MKSPWDRLEAFEAEHGDYAKLFNRLTWLDADTVEQAKVRKLLSIHSRIIYMCMAYNDGLEAGRQEGALEGALRAITEE